MAATLPPLPAQPGDQEWEDRAIQLEFDALPNLRTTATSWATTVGSLTGLFGLAALISGPDNIHKLTLPAEIFVGIFLAIAVGAGVAATYLAAIAAQGSPHTVYTDAVVIRMAFEAEAQQAAVQIQQSRYLALIAITALALGVGVVLFAPQTPSSSSSSNALVVQRSGIVTCVALSTTKGGIETGTSIGRGSAAGPLAGVQFCDDDRQMPLTREARWWMHV